MWCRRSGRRGEKRESVGTCTLRRTDESWEDVTLREKVQARRNVPLERVLSHLHPSRVGRDEHVEAKCAAKRRIEREKQEREAWARSMPTALAELDAGWKEADSRKREETNKELVEEEKKASTPEPGRCKARTGGGDGTEDGAVRMARVKKIEQSSRPQGAGVIEREAGKRRHCGRIERLERSGG